MALAVVDWVLLAVLLASIALGVWRGLVYEVISVLGWVAAFFAAQWWAPRAAAYLPAGWNWSEPVRYAVGFVLVFVAAIFLAGLLAWGIKKAVAAIGLRPADRTLGAAFGLVRGLVLLLAVTLVINLTPLAQAAWWRESQGAPVLSAALRGLRPAFELFGVKTRFMDQPLFGS